MTFNEQLNEYISKLGCTAKDLADASGLSAAVLVGVIAVVIVGTIVVRKKRKKESF